MYLHLVIYLFNMNRMYVIFSTNTVKNHLNLLSKVENEKLSTANREMRGVNR